MAEEQGSVRELSVEQRISEIHQAILKVGFKQNDLIDGVSLVALGVETMRRAGVSNGQIMEDIIMAMVATSKT